MLARAADLLNFAYPSATIPRAANLSCRSMISIPSLDDFDPRLLLLEVQPEA